MTLLETAASVQDQVLEAIKASQKAVIPAVKTFAETTAPIAGILPPPPFADKFPTVSDLVDSAFGFAAKLIAMQKEFVTKLFEAYPPATPAKPVAKATPAKVSA